MLTNIDEHIPNISRDGFWGRNVDIRSPCLHEALESLVFTIWNGHLLLDTQ